MFCSKCGKEIADEAIICPACGCATANYHTPVESKKEAIYSDDYVTIKEFEDTVNGLRGFSIVSLILCLGIGVIFCLIVWMRAKALEIPRIKTTNPNEVALLESAKRRLKTALNFTFIPVYVLLLLSCILLIGGAIGPGFIFLIVTFVVWFIGGGLTKHLNEALK